MVHNKPLNVNRIYNRLVKKAHRLYVKMQPSVERYEWSIGILEGDSPFALHPPAGVTNPVLTRHDVTDVEAQFVADPFMIRHGDTWFMFFEVLNRQNARGEIGLAVSPDGRRWSYHSIVLREDFHLSFPCVFEHQGEHYMLPETWGAGDVRLYRADAFPFQWSVAGIVCPHPGADPMLFQHDGLWWLFMETAPDHGYDCLRAFYGENMFGPWQEHPQSPIVYGNPRSARPAGRIVRLPSGLFRFSQDCFREYGHRVRAFQIIHLSPTRFEEREIPINLGPSGNGWNRFGMHHLDVHQVGDRWIGCSDGR